MIFGYTTGVFDLYHSGHAALLERARSRCDHLTLGLTTDEVAMRKDNPPLMTYAERYAVLRSVRWVDSVIPQTGLDKVAAWQRIKFDVLFVGDDWYDTEDWQLYEKLLEEEGVPVIYFPRTPGISSTEIKQRVQWKG